MTKSKKTKPRSSKQKTPKTTRKPTKASPARAARRRARPTSSTKKSTGTPKSVTIRRDNHDAFEETLPEVDGKWSGQKGNRPRAPKGAPKFSRRVVIKVTPEEGLAWERVAAARRRSVSAVVRELMHQELRRVTDAVARGASPASLRTPELPGIE